MSWFKDIFPEHEECEEAVRGMILVLLRGRWVSQYIPELIDARFGQSISVPDAS